MRAIDRSLRDLMEAGRGSTVLARGRASLEAALATLSAAPTTNLLEVAASQASGVIASTLVDAIREVAPRPFLWRHAESISRLSQGLGDQAEHGALLAVMLREIASIRPLVLLITDLEDANADVLDLLRPLALAAAREPATTSFVVLLHTTSPRNSAVVAAFIADLRPLPGYLASEGAAATEVENSLPQPATTDKESRTLIALAIALAPATAALVAEIAQAEVVPTERALAALLDKNLVHMDSEDGHPRYRAGDLAQAAEHLSTLAPAERAALHARAAGALARRGETANADAQLDAMLSLAREPHERARALLLRAELLARTRPEVARAAVAGLAALPAARDGVLRLRADIASARVEIAAGRRDVATPVLKRARRALTGLLDASPERPALSAAVLALTFELARDALEGGASSPATVARQLLAAPMAETHSGLQLLWGELELGRGRLGDAELRFLNASELARADGDLATLADGLARLSESARHTGHFDPAALAEQALIAAEQVGDSVGDSAGDSAAGVAARVVAARAAFAAGRAESAARALETLEDAARAASPRDLGRFLLAKAELTLAADARAAVGDAKSLSEAAAARRDASLELEARALHARALLAARQPARARAAARGALERALKLGHPLGLGMAHDTWFRVALAEGDDAGAARHAAAALTAFDDAGAARDAAAVLTAATALQLRKPKLRLKAELARRLRTAASVPNLWSGDEAIDRKSLEVVVAALTDSADTADALRQVAEAARAPWAVVTHGGEVLARHGDPPDAVVQRATLLPETTPSSGLAVFEVRPWISTGPAPRLVLPLARESSPPGVLAALTTPLARALLASTSIATRLTPRADGFGRMIGQSTAMLRLFALLERIANNDLPVLLQGESGTGKELAARAIHEASARKDGPFVPIDCAAIPESLIESELFGHKKGAFTGTVDDRKGLLEEAAGGTVFLDEISNISISVQAKLLRVIQERKVRRVGDTALRPIDVRLISAANQPLEESVRSGAFREDLFFRLNVIEVRLPPLRERKDDIPLLVENFLNRIATPAPRLERGALSRLHDYDWPGNVRELENEIRRAAVVARATVITAADLSPRIGEGVTADREGTPPKLKDAVAALELDLLRRALASSDGHRGRAARLLGLSHQGLINKIRKHGLRVPPGKPRST